MIRYAPIIDTHVRGFASDGFGSPIAEIYFTDHPALNTAQTQIWIQVREYGSDNTIYGPYEEDESSYGRPAGVAYFSFDPRGEEPNMFKPAVGQFYQFRIAYGVKEGDELILGPYSAWSVGRYCGGFTITESFTTNTFGQLVCQADFQARQNENEAIAFYRCRLLTDDTESADIIEDSGWLRMYDLLKDIKKDDGRTVTGQSATYVPITDVSAYSSCYVEWSIKTINDYNQSSKLYLSCTLSDNTNTTILVSQDALARENGYVTIDFGDSPQNNGRCLKRHSINDDQWQSITAFDANTKTYNDFSVEQGETYEYAVDSISTSTQTIETTRAKAKPITVDFDSMFLADEERQLCIAFNPEISNFKETILETKIDTIDSKYPYFFRNGSVRYKEFSLSGLLSYHTDLNNFFLQDIKQNDDDADAPEEQVDPTIRVSTAAGSNATKILPTKHFNLTGDNFYQERQFKMEVLKWLNNGKPKYLRTPAEGNYVVRLTNVSLRPNTTLGGMLHSFSATAYEIADRWSDVCDKPIFQGVVKDATTT